MCFLSVKRLTVEYERRMYHPHPTGAATLFDDAPRYDRPMRQDRTLTRPYAPPRLRTALV